MSTTELRKRVIARVKLTKDAILLRELERMLKEAGTEIAPYGTTPEQKRAIAKSRTALKKGQLRHAAEADEARCFKPNTVISQPLIRIAGLPPEQYAPRDEPDQSKPLPR